MAAEYLAGKGYTIVTRRHKTRRGEIDIVALDGETLVFVEVKFRNAPEYHPEESIGTQKLEALSVAIEIYLRETGSQGAEFRLDLIAIDRDGIRHYQDILAP